MLRMHVRVRIMYTCFGYCLHYMNRNRDNRGGEDLFPNEYSDLQERFLQDRSIDLKFQHLVIS